MNPQHSGQEKSIMILLIVRLFRVVFQRVSTAFRNIYESSTNRY